MYIKVIKAEPKLLVKTRSSKSRLCRKQLTICIWYTWAVCEKEQLPLCTKMEIL
jgi:hypothetical protein